MIEENLNKLKQFENILKQCLIKRFGSFLPENKTSLLMNTDYLNSDILKITTDRNYIQGTILRNMLDSIIDVTCIKELNVNNELISISNYGRYLEDGLIEYYVQELAKQFKFNVNEIPELKNNISLVIKLKEYHKDNLDKLVFNATANDLLNAPELQAVTNICDTIAINEYIEKKKIEELNQTNSSNDNLNKNENIQIEIIDNKKYLKYTTLEGTSTLIEIKNEKVNDYYISKMSSLKPDEKLNIKEFWDELIKINNETILDKPFEVIEELPKPQEDEKILSPEEYSELCMKYANNEPLTDEELEALKRSTPELMEESFENTNEEAPVRVSRGFANNSALLYIILITMFIGVFIGAMIFSFIN